MGIPPGSEIFQASLFVLFVVFQMLLPYFVVTYIPIYN